MQFKYNNTSYSPGLNLGSARGVPFNNQDTSIASTNVEDAIKEILDNNTASDETIFRFGVTDDGQYGYIIKDKETGADTVIPFKKGGGGSSEGIPVVINAGTALAGATINLTGDNIHLSSSVESTGKASFYVPKIGTYVLSSPSISYDKAITICPTNIDYASKMEIIKNGVELVGYELTNEREPYYINSIRKVSEPSLDVGDPPITRVDGNVSANFSAGMNHLNAIYTSKSIDMTPFKTLTVEFSHPYNNSTITELKAAQTGCYFYIADKKYFADIYDASKDGSYCKQCVYRYKGLIAKANVATTLVMDVSDVTGNYFIGFKNRSSYNDHILYIYNITLE